MKKLRTSFLLWEPTCIASSVCIAKFVDIGFTYDCHTSVLCFKAMDMDGCSEVQSGFDTPNLALHLAVSEIEEGSLLQLHVRDSTWSQQGLHSLIKVKILLFRK